LVEPWFKILVSALVTGQWFFTF